MKQESCSGAFSRQSFRDSGMTLDGGFSDHLDAERFSALGPEPVLVLDLSDRSRLAALPRLRASTQAVLIGLHQEGRIDPEIAAALDLIISTDPQAGLPCVGMDAGQARASIDKICSNVRNTPLASTILCHALRLNEKLDLPEALMAESAAYSTLLAGSEFRRWRSANPPDNACLRERPDGAPVSIERAGDLVTITLSAPETRNAMSASMRDALFEALASVADDPTEPRLLLRAKGACFSTGGAVEEFGKADDLALAHVIRTVRSATLLLHVLGDRAQVELHGACIGSGIEVPMAAAHRSAAPGTFVQLPEVRMGLIPGAGGTVTLPRAIGRHRTAWLALSARRLRLETVSVWGFVHGEARK
jgi:hypothetical protein